MRTLEQIQKEREKLRIEYQSKDDLLALEEEKLKREIQEKCPHDWKWKGDGHGKDFYICTSCKDFKVE